MMMLEHQDLDCGIKKNAGETKASSIIKVRVNFLYGALQLPEIKS